MSGSRVTTHPLDTRIYAGPAGRRCRLEAGIVTGPWVEQMWSVALLGENGRSPIAGVPAIEHLGTREQARASYRQRLAALKAAGWRRLGQE